MREKHKTRDIHSLRFIKQHKDRDKKGQIERDREKKAVTLNNINLICL